MPELIIAAVAGAVVLILLTAKMIKKSRLKGNNVEEIKGVRYTATSDTTKPHVESDADVKLSYNKTDILIPVKEEKVVGKDADLKPGKYIILTTNEEIDTLNVRLGGYVRVYNHGSEVILAEGDTICPVNIGIILR